MLIPGSFNSIQGYAYRRAGYSDFREVVLTASLDACQDASRVKMICTRSDNSLFPDESLRQRLEATFDFEFITRVARLLAQGNEFSRLEITSIALSTRPYRRFMELRIKNDNEEAYFCPRSYRRDSDDVMIYFRLSQNDREHSQYVDIYLELEGAKQLGKQLLAWLHHMRPCLSVERFTQIADSIEAVSIRRGYTWFDSLSLCIEMAEEDVQEMLREGESPCRITKLSRGYFLEFGQDLSLGQHMDHSSVHAVPTLLPDATEVSGQVTCRCYSSPDLSEVSEGTLTFKVSSKLASHQSEMSERASKPFVVEASCIISCAYPNQPDRDDSIEIRKADIINVHDIAIRCCRIRDVIHRFVNHEVDPFQGATLTDVIYTNYFECFPGFRTAKSIGGTEIPLVHFFIWPNESTERSIAEGFFRLEDLEQFGEELMVLADRAHSLSKSAGDQSGTAYWALHEPLNPPYTTTGIAVWKEGFLAIKFDSPLGENWKDLSETACEFSKTSRGWRLFFAYSDTGWDWDPNIKQLEFDL